MMFVVTVSLSATCFLEVLVYANTEVEFLALKKPVTCISESKVR